MPRHGHMRHGSLQFWPRKRARKILPRVSWKNINRTDVGLLGFIGYKVGMKSAYVKDNGQYSLTKGQKITIPVTIIEFPSMKILSVRFYKDKRLIGEVLNQNLDKELKKKLKLPKIKVSSTTKGEASPESKGKISSEPEGSETSKIGDFKEDDYDNIRVIVYSQVKKTGIKKKPDIVEIGLSGSKEDKLSFVKENLAKEISVRDFLNDEFLKEGIVDIRGVTKGKGLQGPTKRFGSGGPWHPARVDYTQPMAGQMGYFTRVINNNKIIEIGNINEKDINPKSGFKKFGKIKNDYAIIYGSVQGPSKRQLLITVPFRVSKNQTKKNFELLELR